MRQMTIACHRERRAGNPENQRQQRPHRRHGCAHPHHRLECRRSGSPDRLGQRSGGAGQPVTSQHRQRRDGHRRVDGQRDAECQRYCAGNGARRVVDFLAQRRDPRISGEREEQDPGRPQHAAEPAARPNLSEIRCARSEDDDQDNRQHHQHDGDDHPRHERGLLHADVVDRGQDGDGRDGDRVRLRRPGVVADGERHRRARRRLASDESPSGKIAPELAQPLAAVHITTAGLRVARGQSRRRGRVAVCHDGRHRQTYEQPGARRGRRRRQRDEYAGSDHRAQADDDGVGQAEAALERRAGHGPTLRRPLFGWWARRAATRRWRPRRGSASLRRRSGCSRRAATPARSGIGRRSWYVGTPVGQSLPASSRRCIRCRT